MKRCYIGAIMPNNLFLPHFGAEIFQIYPNLTNMNYRFERFV